MLKKACAAAGLAIGAAAGALLLSSPAQAAPRGGEDINAQAQKQSVAITANNTNTNTNTATATSTANASLLSGGLI
ncbi:MAG: hypothetical protein IRY92_00305 [Dactylosporangium sp.]|nr:hypothetical protein [Dactylosporangium sp.]